jgi:hypothetical protein
MKRKPQWLAQANLCGCGLVAVTLLRADQMDPAATLEADDDTEAVAVGDDWRLLTREVAATMMERTGQQMCLLGSLEHTHRRLDGKDAEEFVSLIEGLGVEPRIHGLFLGPGG